MLRIEHPDLPKDPQSIRDIHKNVELTSVAGGQSFISVKHHHKSRFGKYLHSLFFVRTYKSVMVVGDSSGSKIWQLMETYKRVISL